MRHCERSEAIQRCARREDDRFVARAPRNDGEAALIHRRHFELGAEELRPHPHCRSASRSALTCAVWATNRSYPSGRHHPRKRVIQYSRGGCDRTESAAAYWILRWSLSSGSPKATRWRSMTM